MSYRIQITVDGETYPISRDVATTHPQAVHDAMGTRTESELQTGLDQMYVGDWYDDQGRHKGPDVNGLEMFWDNELAALIGKRVEAGEEDDHDIGRVERIDSPTMAYVAWDSGVKTQCPISDLTVQA